MALTPIVVVVLVCFLLYRYAERLSIDDIKPAEIELLAVGIKLLGFYALLESIAYLVGTVVAIGIQRPASSEMQWGSAVKVAITGVAYLYVGVVMVFRTQWLMDRTSGAD